MSLETRVPMGAHWAILGTEQVFIPGDERSRTNPGHGYPERTETFVTYEAFKDYVTFELSLKRRLLRGDKVIGIQVGMTYTKDAHSIAITKAETVSSMTMLL